MARQSILAYFHENAALYGARTATLSKRDGRYVAHTWSELAAQTERLAAGLLALGIVPGDRVCIAAHTRLEWVLADFAVLSAGAVTVPIYPSNLADECQYIAENSGAVLAICEDAAQARKLLDGRAKLPALRHLVILDGPVPTGEPGGPELSSWAALQAHPVDAAMLAERAAGLRRDGVASIIYTSGTTGRPKGVIITHDNMVYEAEAVSQIDIVRESDVHLFFLPLAHVFAKVLVVAWLCSHHQLAFAESMTTLQANMAEVHPTLMGGVPRVYEKFYAAVLQKAGASRGLAARLFTRALALSEAHGEAEAAGRRLPLASAVQFALLRAVVLRKVGRALGATLGGRMRLLVSGGAPLSPKISWFFRDVGLELVEGFGLTETCAATCVNRVGRNRIGTVGLPLPGTEVRLAADGELLIRGRGVSPGYWHNDAATREAFVDGWFATGDIAKLDPDLSVRIVDRKKDLIVTAGGKNVAPQNLENLLKTDPLISQAVVHGDRRSYLTALVTLDADALRAFAAAHQLGNASYAELSQRAEVYAAVLAAIENFNRQLASFETIKKFKILEHDFSQESGEMTPSLKVKRKVVNQRYAALFDSFYAAPGV